MIAKPDVLDDIISHLDPEEVPTEFIVMAKVITFDGEERLVDGKELESIMENPEEHNVAEARVILDVVKVRTHIMQMTKDIFAAVDRLA